MFTSIYNTIFGVNNNQIDYAELKKVLGNNYLITELSSEYSSIKTAISSFECAIKFFPSIYNNDWTLTLGGDNSNVYAILVRISPINNEIETKIISELSLSIDDNFNVRDFIYNTVNPLQSKYEWQFTIIYGNMYNYIYNNDNMWAKNMLDLEGFIHPNTDQNVVNNLIAPTLEFQDDNEEYLFDIMGIALNIVRNGNISYSPSFINESEGLIENNTITAKDSYGEIFTIEYIEGDTNSLLEAVQKIKSMTGVDHFYFISD